MKYIKYFTFFLLYFLAFHTFSQPAQYGFYDNFYRGILDNGEQHDYTKFNNLNLNLWCHYQVRNDADPQTFHQGWVDLIANDLLETDVTDYKQRVIEKLDSNNMFGMRTVMDRIKIANLALGQRSDYMCSEDAKTDTYYNFYAFENHDSRDEDVPDNGHHVRYVPHLDNNGNPISPHEVVSGLRANREQVCTWGWYYNDTYHDFYVKPRIRIQTGLNDETAVCEITFFNCNI